MFGAIAFGWAAPGQEPLFGPAPTVTVIAALAPVRDLTPAILVRDLAFAVHARDLTPAVRVRALSTSLAVKDISQS